MIQKSYLARSAGSSNLYTIYLLRILWNSHYRFQPEEANAIHSISYNKNNHNDGFPSPFSNLGA